MGCSSPLLNCIFFEDGCYQAPQDTRDMPCSELKAELSQLPSPEQSYKEAGAAIRTFFSLQSLHLGDTKFGKSLRIKKTLVLFFLKGCSQIIYNLLICLH